MTTLQLIKQYFKEENLKLPKDQGKLESKKELKEFAKFRFQQDLDDGASPLLAFELLYHRLTEIAKIAKDVFYEPAIEELRNRLDEGENSTELFGTKLTLRTSEEYEVVPSPKMKKLEKELEKLQQKNNSVLKKYEKFKTDSKSIQAQINAEKERLIELKLAKKTDTKESISLSY